MYHGSAQKFTRFDKSKIDAGYLLYGPGFYFTENKDVAQGLWDTSVRWKDFSDAASAEAFRKSQKWPLVGYPVWSDARGETVVYKAAEQLVPVLKAAGYTQKGFPPIEDRPTREKIVEQLNRTLDERGRGYLSIPEREWVEGRLREFLTRDGDLVKLQESINEQPYNMDVFSAAHDAGVDVHGNLYPVYLNIRHPFYIDKSMTQDEVDQTFGKDFGKRLSDLADNLQGGGNYLGLEKVGPKKDEYEGGHLYHYLTDYEHGRAQVQERYSSTAREYANDVLKKAGFDGISHKGNGLPGTGTHRVWIAFEPTQIKSVENRGTFDLSDPDIRHARCGTKARYTYNPNEPRLPKGDKGGGEWTVGPLDEVKSSLVDGQKQWRGSLSDRERNEGFKRYCGSTLASVINRDLRSGRSLYNRSQTVFNLTQALNRASLPKRVVARRLLGDFDGKLLPMFKAHLGKTILDRGFVSASLSDHYIDETIGLYKNHYPGDPPLLDVKISVPAGSKAAYIDKSMTNEPNMGEEELLIQRASRFKVLKADSDGIELQLEPAK